jgi:type IV pilus assembly protein PilC
MFFNYEAFERKSGKIKKGKTEGSSREQVVSQLKKEGLQVIKLEEGKPGILTKGIWIGKPVKMEEFVVFCRQLATLLQSGSTIVDSMSLLTEQAKSKPFKNALLKIGQEVRAGVAFSDACQHYPKIFNKVFVNMIKAGEVSGNLDDVMNRLAIFYEKEHHIREKVKSALSYPIIVSLIAVIVVVFLLTSVIPQLVGTLQQAGGSLPLPTLIVITLSDFIREMWYIPLAVAGAIFFLFLYLKSQPKGRYWMDYAQLKLPVFGVLIQKSAIARMCRTLSSLFKSAVPVLQSLNMVIEIVDNEVIAKTLRESRESLQAGESLSQPLSKNWVFPSLVTHMIKVGEESGQMDTMLDKVADFYDSDVEHMSSRLSAIIEPIMIVILAVVVGTIVLAALLPMFEIYQNV